MTGISSKVLSVLTSANQIGPRGLSDNLSCDIDEYYLQAIQEPKVMLVVKVQEASTDVTRSTRSFRVLDASDEKTQVKMHTTKDDEKRCNYVYVDI